MAFGKAYYHESYTVRELRALTKKKCGIVFFSIKRKLGDWVSQFYKENFRFSRYKTDMKDPWVRHHTFIRLPFFWYERNNSGVRIGTWFHYLWFIRPIGSSL